MNLYKSERGALVFCNIPFFNYVSVPADNNPKSRLLVLSCEIHLLYFLTQITTGLYFK